MSARIGRSCPCHRLSWTADYKELVPKPIYLCNKLGKLLFSQ